MNSDDFWFRFGYYFGWFLMIMATLLAAGCLGGTIYVWTGWFIG